MFKLGDRVISLIRVGDTGKLGSIGTIIRINSLGYLVEFDNDIGGHDGGCTSGGKDRHCWNVYFDDVKLYCDVQIDGVEYV